MNMSQIGNYKPGGFCSDKPAPKIECGDLPDYNFVMHHLTKELNRMQEEVLRGVLRQILGREPEIQDAKLLTIIRYPGDMLDYTLAYGGSEIGRVIFENNMTTWTITFKPNISPEMPELFESKEPKV